MFPFTPRSHERGSVEASCDQGRRLPRTSPLRALTSAAPLKLRSPPLTGGGKDGTPRSHERGSVEAPRRDVALVRVGRPLRALTSAAPLKLVQHAPHLHGSLPLRALTSAAPLKPGRHTGVPVECRTPRSHERGSVEAGCGCGLSVGARRPLRALTSAAPLKRSRAGREPPAACPLRALTSAAPLKPEGSARVFSDRPTPRSHERGSVEAFWIR